MELMEIKGTCLVRYHGREEEVCIPDHVEEISTEAFAWCSDLKRITGGRNVRMVRRDAFLGTPFYRFYHENETDWTEDYVYIGSCLLAARRNIRVAHIPEGTTMIAADAFRERVLLREVTFPSTLTYIDWRAFSDCFSLTELTIPGNVKKMGWHCLKGCKRLKQVKLEEGIEILENGVFSECRSIRHITFPKSLIKLGGWMFFGCANLEQVHFLGDLEEFYERTFSECSNLHQVDFPPGLKRIGSDCFYNCTNLERAPLPDALEVIGKNAFAGDKFLEEVHFPEALRSIGAGAFAACQELRRLHLPGKITKINDHTFLNCDKLEELTIYPGTEEIGDSVFQNCRNLIRVELPDTIRKIGREAFAGCQRMTRITMPSALEQIGSDLFRGCRGLADEDGFYVIDKVCYGYDGSNQLVSVPDGVEEVADGAFRGKDRYTEIRLPRTVGKVGIQAFHDCGSLSCLVGPNVGLEHWEEAVRLEAATGFCAFWKEYEPKYQAGYERYIRENREMILKKGIDQKLSYIIHYFTKFSLIEQKDFNRVLEYAQRQKAMEAVAILLEYRNSQKEEDLFDKYALD